MNEVSSPRSGLFQLGFKQESRARPGPGFWVGWGALPGGPAQYILTAIPNHRPSI